MAAAPVDELLAISAKILPAWIDYHDRKLRDLVFQAVYADTYARVLRQLGMP